MEQYPKTFCLSPGENPSERVEYIRSDIAVATIKNTAVEQYLKGQEAATPQWHDAADELPDERTKVLCRGRLKTFVGHWRTLKDDKTVWFDHDMNRQPRPLFWLDIPTFKIKHNGTSTTDNNEEQLTDND